MPGRNTSPPRRLVSVLALGGPFGLLALPVAWLVLVLVAYLVGLLAAARRARGIRAGSRALSCWRRGAIEGYSWLCYCPCMYSDRPRPAHPAGQ